MAQIHIRKNLLEIDFTKNFVHLANQEQIVGISMKYNLASKYPQNHLSRLSMPCASKIVTIEGTRVHLILQWSPNMEDIKYGLWAFPDEEKYIEKYSTIFDTLYEINLNRQHKKTIQSSLQ